MILDFAVAAVLVGFLMWLITNGIFNKELKNDKSR